MYATTEELITRYGQDELLQLACQADDESQIDDKVVKTALIDAYELINSYVAVKHALPLSVVPEVLKRINCELARYFLYKGVKPEDLEKTYEKNIRYLRDVAQGGVILEHSASGQAPTQADEVIFTGSSARLFSHHQMKGF